MHVAIDRATSGLVSHYVAVCEAAKRASIVREKLDRARVSVVPIGIPEREIPCENREQIRKELGVPEGARPVIGILANLRDMKGHRHALAALPEILKQEPDAAFLFAGRDDSNGEIARLVEQMGMTEHVIMPGFVSDSARVLAAIDLFLLPSDWEGFPVSILEAMHAKVPVIASNVGGIPEMIRHGEDGVLIPPGSPPAIAEAIIFMSRDWAARGNMVKSAHTRAVTEFSQQNMVEGHEQIFEGLMKNP
jgi:glycosyltransferase involved in cell wall biosynthesis